MTKAPRDTPDKPPDWVPPGQRPDHTPPGTEASPTVWQFNLYSFTVRLQGHQATGDHLGDNVVVIAANPDDALQALRDNFGDNLLTVRGGTMIYGAAYMAASAATSGAKGFLRRI